MLNINLYYQNNLLKEYNRSEYYPLEPIGIGTPFVESLTGYISRLAKTHSVKTSEFVIHLEDDKGKFYRRMGDRITINHSKIKNLYALNGKNEDTSKCVEILQSKTRCKDIINTTLLSITSTISRLGLLKKSRAWCPVCYEETLKSGSPVYDQLIWNFQDVSVCTKHKIQLVEKCPHCGKLNFPFKGNIVPGFCTQCLRWLGSMSVAEREDISSYYYWKSEQIGKLLAKIPSINNDNVKLILLDNIKNASQHYTNGNTTEFARISGLDKGTILYWINNDGNPSINEILHLSYVLSVDLENLLTIPNLTYNYPIKAIIDIKKEEKVNKRVILESLKKYTDDYDKDPVSLAEITRRLKVHKKLLLNNFPDLCEEINLLYKKYKKSQRKFKV